MTVVLITIACDNAAFEDNSAELGQILRGAAESYGRINDWPTGTEQSLYDSNGNKVGTLTIAVEPD